jgi:hypothetical protein
MGYLGGLEARQKGGWCLAVLLERHDIRQASATSIQQPLLIA